MEIGKPQNKILGIGLSKTGTTSLYLALCQLGYRTATSRHMKQLTLREWFNGNFSVDYLEGFSAATDLPMATWFRELDKRYPNSKFILTERPTKEWLVSIKRQFEVAPSPALFNRECRLIQYGIGVFNEERFCRIQKEHSISVREYFSDRPEDLLVLNLFEGEGWDELCGFLGRKPLRESFPNAKPGAQLEASKVRPKYLPEEHDSFAFIIPLVHPDNDKVKDYKIVEQVLQYSIASCMAQTSRKVFAIVVCSVAPDWAQNLPTAWKDRVFFLTLDDHPAFAANRNDVQVDKGMKLIIGGIFAIDKLRAGWVMSLDGDDYICTSLSESIFARGAGLKGDGFVLRQGIHVRLIPHYDSATIYSAIKINSFDLTCGSSRVFHSRPFAAILENLDPEIFSLAAHFETCSGEIIPVPPEVVSEIDAMVWPTQEARNSTVRLLGRHVRQEPFISLTPIDGLLVAKGCGHGNHDGPRGGDIHWHRGAGTISPKKVLAHFGLEQTNIAVAPWYSKLRIADILRAVQSSGLRALAHHSRRGLGRLKRIVK